MGDLVARTSFEPVDVLIKPLPITKPPLPRYILDIAKRQNKEKEEHKRKEEEQRRKEEEREEIEAARKEYTKIVLSRMEVMRKIGQPVFLMPLLNLENVDYRELLNPKSNCEEIDCGSGPVGKEIVLEKEKSLWNAAMEYRKVQNMDSEYDLIPSNMTLFPIMSKKCMWYHCNLVGCKRETPSKGVQQYFFLEINLTRAKTVTACIALDDNVDNTCNACPSRIGILHPCKGGFTCGSKEGGPSKEDFEAIPARALDRDVMSPGLPAPLPTLGNETLVPMTRRLSALVGDGTSRRGPPAAAAIGTHPKSKSLAAAMPNGRPGHITKRQLESALALAGGGTSSHCSSEDNPTSK